MKNYFSSQESLLLLVAVTEGIFSNKGFINIVYGFLPFWDMHLRENYVTLDTSPNLLL